MAKVDIFKKRDMSADISSSGLKYVVPPKISFEAEAEFDNKIFDQVRKDSILLSDMNDDVTVVYKKACKDIENKLAVFDKLIVGMVDKGEDKKDIDKQIDGLNKALERDRDVAEVAAKLAAEQTWKTYAKKKKEYSAYKIKIVVSVVGSVAGLATSIGMMASSPFTAGLGTVTGLIGMVKSVVQIGKELASAWQEVETAVKLLTAQIGFVEKAAKNMLTRKVNEYTGAVLTQFLGVAEPSIKSCKSHLETVQAKLKGIEIKTHDASSELNDILDAQEKFSKEFVKAAKERLAKHPSPKAKTQQGDIENDLDAELGKSRIDFMQQRDVVTNLYQRFKDAKADVDDLEKRVDAVSLKRGVDERLLRLILSLADIPLSITESVLEKNKNFAADLATNLAPWIADLAYEKISDHVLDKTFLER